MSICNRLDLQTQGSQPVTGDRLGEKAMSTVDGNNVTCVLIHSVCGRKHFRKAAELALSQAGAAAKGDSVD